jgi:uncharacterized C2H2 Zn-finger protein
MEPVVDNKCYNCGKMFKLTKDLIRHKNRKTPCLIREIADDQKLNPNRCIYCNKIFNKAANLTRHLSICKIKNGGMEILVDKVVYEQKFRALEEQNQMIKDENNKKDNRIKELEDQLEDVWTRFEEVEEKIKATTQVVGQGAIVVNGNVQNNNNIQIQQIQQIQQINIHINDYDKPSLVGVMPTPEELAQSSGEPLIWSSLRRIFFDKSRPENHSVFMSNKKERDLVAYHGGDWRLYSGKTNTDRIALVMLKIADTFSHQVSNHYGVSNEIFDALPGPAQTAIKEWTGKTYGLKTRTPIEDIFPLDGVYDQILQNREIIRPTLVASGCKLIK